MPLRPFGIHEQTWFPQFLRDQVVDGLQTILDIMNTCEPIAQFPNSLAEGGFLIQE